MAKVMVFQHVPYEPLGTLDPMIRSHRHRIRYINFGRDPDATPDLVDYDALIVLGGPMNIGDEENYPHLLTEQVAIRQAITLDIPILGICLGAQLIAAALGARVYPANELEIGWYAVEQTRDAINDPVMRHFSSQTHVFQWHGFTFNLPDNAELLLRGQGCENQAFRYGDKIYGFQFHLEADKQLIKRWLNLPEHQQELGLDQAQHRISQIWQQTDQKITHSLELSHHVFGSFIEKIPRVSLKHRLLHRKF